jgi:hypothetical protein
MMGALAAAMFDLRSRRENPGPESDPRKGRDRQRPSDARETKEDLKSQPDLRQVKEKGDDGGERFVFFFLESEK